MSKLRVLDLFSGIGGFSLGLERTGGFETVAFCEIDPFCRQVLAKHWPAVPIHEDVRTLRHDGNVDVVCGGYPCQPFSLAGKRRGQEDDRHLWPEMYRLVAECRPSWVLGENVSGHITMGLDEVLSDLETLDYAVRAFVVPACAVDAPHRRDRVWVVAHANIQRGNGRTTEHRPNRWALSARKRVAPDAYCSRLEVGKGPHTSRARTDGGAFFGGIARWSTEPSVGRVATGVPNRVDRLRTLGNAVVPQVVEMIGHAILAAEAEFGPEADREE